MTWDTEQDAVRCIDCRHWRGAHGWCATAGKNAGSARAQRRCAHFERMPSPAMAVIARWLEALTRAWDEERRGYRSKIEHLTRENAALRTEIERGTWHRLFSIRQRENEALRAENEELRHMNATLDARIEWLKRMQTGRVQSKPH